MSIADRGLVTTAATRTNHVALVSVVEAHNEELLGSSSRQFGFIHVTEQVRCEFSSCCVSIRQLQAYLACRRRATPIDPMGSLYQRPVILQESRVRVVAPLVIQNAKNTGYTTMMMMMTLVRSLVH